LKISELRRRNGLVNQCYKHVHILGAGRLWIDYGRTLRKALIAVERESFKRKPEENKDAEDEDESEEDDEEEEGEEEEESSDEEL
jgi:hypothetical protein